MHPVEQESRFAIVLLPDPSEIEGLIDPDFIYSGGYSQYTKEIRELYDEIVSAWYADNNPQKVNEIRLSLPPASNYAGYFPEFIFELGAALSAGAVGAGLFKLLDVWVKKSNGRKLRVRLPSGLEVEATQMTHGEFEKLIAKLHETYDGDQKASPQISYSNDLQQIEKLLDDAIRPGVLISKSDADEEKSRLKELYIQNRLRIKGGDIVPRR
jgi:hypothetical protein